jgi:hypothetical protein
MTGWATCELTGRWRIVQADLWDRGYFDLVEPAYLQIGNDGRAEFAFGAVNAIAELEYGYSTVLFRWSGFDEATKSPVPDQSSCKTTAPSKSFRLLRGSLRNARSFRPSWRSRGQRKRKRTDSHLPASRRL